MLLDFWQANLLKKSINRKASQKQHKSTTTVANSIERHDLLQSSKKTAGHFFRITKGCEALTCDDMLIAFEREEMAKWVKKLNK